LVTGGSGLIGHHVLEALLDAGYEPRAYSRHAVALAGGAVEKVRGDVRDRAALAAAMKGCEAVVHAAAVYSYARADRGSMMGTNVEGTRNVLDAAARAGVERVVVTSSAATCGPVAGRSADERDSVPAWELAVPYKRSKVEAERLALARAAAGQDIVVVNPTTTVGAGDLRPTPSGCMVRDVLARRIRGYIHRGGLNVVSARDVAVGHVLALERGRRGERYLLGGENLPMERLFALIALLGGVPAPRIAIPYAAALLAARALDAVARAARWEPKLLVLDEVRLARVPMYFETAKAERELGYTHRPAPQALRPAVAWFSARQARPPLAGARPWTYSSARARGATGPGGGKGSS
jgi:dihydroflavonol-4-reductase